MMREWFYKNERFVLGYLEQLQRLRRTSSAPPYILLFFPKVQKGNRKWTKKMSKIQKCLQTFAKNIICDHN